MKINMELDISPEEARKMMGLPDVEPMQKEMLAKFQEYIEQSVEEMSNPELLMKRFFPMGVQGMEQFQKFISGVTKAATSGGVNRENNEGK